MQIPAELQDVLVQLLVAVVSLVVGLLGFYGRAYLKQLEKKIASQVGTAQWDWLREYINETVHAVAQNPAFEGWSGDKLKLYVKNQALIFVDKYKLPVDQGDVDAMIEAAVYWLKRETKE